MSKTTETHLKLKSRQSKTNRNQSVQSNSYKEILRGFQNEWKAAKSELISSHDFQETLQIRISEEKADIKTLQLELAKRDEEAGKKLEEYMNLKNDLDSIKKEYLQLQDKYAALEIPYDKNMQEKEAFILQLQQEIAKQNEAHKQLHAEFEQRQREWDGKLSEKSLELQQKDLYIKEIELNIEQLTNTISENKKQFEANKEEITKSFESQLSESEEKIATLQEQIKGLEDLVQKCVQENKDLEDAHTKLIEEQNYRARTIGRVCFQPVSLIQPHKNARQEKSPEVFSANGTDNESKKDEFKAPNHDTRVNRTRPIGQRRRQQEQPTTSPPNRQQNKDVFATRASVIKSSSNLPNGKFAIIRKVQMLAVGSSKEDSNQQERNQTQQQTTKEMTSKIAYAHSENEFSSDDDGSVVGKDVIDDFINMDSSSNSRSANERKRPSEPYMYVETSDSETNEKRSRI